MEILTAQDLKARLEASNIYAAHGQIQMILNGTSVSIKSTDTIGNNIQEWLAQWLVDNDIYHRPPSNTQNFPDFYLSESETSGLMEVKSFYALRRPGFDVANFDSYWKSLAETPYRLDADYLVFAYDMNDGVLSIKQIYLKKVWELTGKATAYPLNCQRKNGQIYNIRPNSFHSNRVTIPAFTSRKAFIGALYQTLLGHTNKAAETRRWLSQVIEGYRSFSGYDLSQNIGNYI